MDRRDTDSRVGRRENAEHLVSERLTYLVNARKVELHALEPLEAVGHSLRLGARHQLFALMHRWCCCTSLTFPISIAHCRPVAAFVARRIKAGAGAEPRRLVTAGKKPLKRTRE